MTNTALADLLKCLAAHATHVCPQPLNIPGDWRDAILRLADEVASRPDPAPLRLWVLATDKHVNIDASATCPGPGYREVALKETV